MKKIILSLGAILVVIVFTIIFILKYNGPTYIVQEDNREKTEFSISSVHVNYVEGDEDLDYNYIVNPEKLIQFRDMPYVAIADLGNELNLFMKESGYTKQKLEIYNASKEGTITTLKLVMSNSKNLITVSYDVSKNKYSFFITVK